MLADVQPGTHKTISLTQTRSPRTPCGGSSEGPHVQSTRSASSPSFASVALVGVAEGIAGSRKKVRALQRYLAGRQSIPALYGTSAARPQIEPSWVPGCRSAGWPARTPTGQRITSRAGNDALGRFRGAVFATETDVRRELVTT